MIQSSTLIDADFVRTQLTGELFTPADEGWDDARGRLEPRRRPAPRRGRPSRRRRRRRRARRLRPRGRPPGLPSRAPATTPSAYGRLGDTLLIKTERMREVEVDPAARIARVEAGVTWGEVVGPAAEHGLRRCGLLPRRRRGRLLARRRRQLARPQARPRPERITAVEIVTADGELRRVDRRQRPRAVLGAARRRRQLRRRHRDRDQLLDRAEVYAGALFFPIERGGEVLERVAPLDRRACPRR